VPSLAHPEQIYLKAIRSQIMVVEIKRDAAFQEIEDLRKKLLLNI
jgi:hypothetical protein